MHSKKKKILFHSDFALAKTGFGRNTKAVLSYLYKTGKYDIVNYCCHIQQDVLDLEKTPWKSVGSMPANPNEVNQYLSSFPEQHREEATRSAWYGALSIDKVVNAEKPDVYFGVQDIWGVAYSIDKSWFNKITSVIWTTLDSLPLFPVAVEKASKIKNYWMWSSFATNEMHRLGHNNVQTMHGAIDSQYFHPLEKNKKEALRKENGISQDTFLIGFVFRNQLRKSVDNLMAGYSLWKKQRPNIKSGLLLHTSFSEGWNIPNLAKENNIPEEEIFTTYICRNCKKYHVAVFKGEEKSCHFCGAERACFTTNLSFGVSESELNEVYNLMDVYCHPFTSGGQEIPIQEAKLAGLITLVTNYSCGEEMCLPEAHSLPLAWEKYREFGTQFIKATTLKESICEQIEKVYSMPLEEKTLFSEMARKWTLDNFSVEAVGKKIEEFLDTAPIIDWENLDLSSAKSINPNAEIPAINDDKFYIKYLYKNILGMDVNDDDGGFKHWISQISKGVGKKPIEDYFRKVAHDEIQKNKSKEATLPKTLESLLDKDDEGRRILYVMPDGIGDAFLSTALFKSLKETYPEYNLYVSTNEKFFDVFAGNQYIHKLISYSPEMDNLLFLEGIGNHKGFFEIAFVPFVTTQRFLTYLHNGKTRIAYNDLKD